MVVLTDDIMKIDPLKILTTRVEKTIIAGDVVYDAPRESGGLAQ
jgi:predicted amidohydrolase YtcJ